MNRDSGATVTQGTRGGWWSQGANSNIGARALALVGNYTNPEYDYHKTYGFSVRCVGSTRVNDILHQFPFSLPYSGAVLVSGETVRQGSGGYFYSSYAASNIEMVDFNTSIMLDTNSGYVYPNEIFFKTGGRSVRRVISTRVNDILHQFPFSLPYSGYVDRGDGKVYYQGTYGLFWSAGSDSATHARYLDIHGNDTYPEGSHYKTNGFSIRCDQGSTRVNDILHQFPFSLPYTGYIRRQAGDTTCQGECLDLWSAGANSATGARALSMADAYTGPEHWDDYKTYGFSVRCVVVKFTTLLSVIICKISCLSL